MGSTITRAARCTCDPGDFSFKRHTNSPTNESCLTVVDSAAMLFVTSPRPLPIVALESDAMGHFSSRILATSTRESVLRCDHTAEKVEKQMRELIRILIRRPVAGALDDRLADVLSKRAPSLEDLAAIATLASYSEDRNFELRTGSFLVVFHVLPDRSVVIDAGAQRARFRNLAHIFLEVVRRHRGRVAGAVPKKPGEQVPLAPTKKVFSNFRHSEEP